MMYHTRALLYARVGHPSQGVVRRLVRVRVRVRARVGARARVRVRVRVRVRAGVS